MRSLFQSHEWASNEVVDVVGPRGTLKKVRVLGPCRVANQIEISETDSFFLGIAAPVHLSGNIADTPTVTLVGSKGTIQTNGAIIAKRHIHMNPDDAKKLELKNGDIVEVEIGGPRSTIFRDVAIRVDPKYSLEMHIDTDEANAASISHGGEGAIIKTTIAY